MISNASRYNLIGYWFNHNAGKIQKKTCQARLSPSFTALTNREFVNLTVLFKEGSNLLFLLNIEFWLYLTLGTHLYSRLIILIQDRFHKMMTFCSHQSSTLVNLKFKIFNKYNCKTGCYYYNEINKKSMQ